MRKFRFPALAAFAVLTIVSCSNDDPEEADYELRTLTFESYDSDFTPYTLDYCHRRIMSWNDLIDDAQYGGELLYSESMTGESHYRWTDEGNTNLAHEMCEAYGSYAYWSGAHAISNYASFNVDGADYTRQLSVFGKGGHNNSMNFAVHNGYIDDSGYATTTAFPALTFSDGIARVIDHLWVTNTLYTYNSLKNGDAYTQPVAKGDWLKAVAIGYDAQGRKTGTTEIYLCNGPEKIITDWVKWNLSSLGAVVKVAFNVEGSEKTEWGLVRPAYFAYDDVAVRFSK